MSVSSQLTLFRRQALQRLPLASLSWPSADVLGVYESQQAVYDGLLTGPLSPTGPEQVVSRWTSHFCMQLSKKIEEAAQVSEEGDIFDPLVEHCASVQACAVRNDADDAQRDVEIVYAAGDDEHDMLQVRLLEKPRVVSASGYTGHRTWEAALALSQMIYHQWIPEGRLKGKGVLELGAGTGLLSFLCAASREGAARVVATDGDEESVRRLQLCKDLNVTREPQMTNNMAFGVYAWGEPFEGSVIEREMQNGPFDFIVGADLTYEPWAIPRLVKTLSMLLRAHPETKCIISATVRNKRTLESFERHCASNDLAVNSSPAPFTPMSQQQAFFYDCNHEVRFLHITPSRNDP